MCSWSIELSYNYKLEREEWSSILELCVAVLAVCEVMFQKVAVTSMVGISFQLLLRDKALEKLFKEQDQLRARMEDRATQWVNLSHTNKKLQADLAVCRDKKHTLHLKVYLLYNL